MSNSKVIKKKEDQALGFFARYLTVWVAICIVAGVILGQILPIVP
jgi:arsenite transporter